MADDTAACSSTSDPVSGTVTNARGEEEEIGRSWSCSLTPETADCGVSRIWVAPQVKRRHIATRMVNALRSHLTRVSSIWRFSSLLFVQLKHELVQKLFIRVLRLNVCVLVNFAF